MALPALGARRARVSTAVAVALLGLVLSACSSGPPAFGPAHGVGLQMENLVDPTRPTAPNGSVQGHLGRIFVTTVLYPAEGPISATPVTGATPDTAHGPYPLIVFAHGFGSDVKSNLPLLERWAEAGYVVAAPLFPLTHSHTLGGPDLDDYVNQPGDMSFIVTQMLDQSATSNDPLAGLIDRSEVGAAGHSLGGVTTLGLVANTCCRDKRIKAAVVMSGDPIAFPTGQVDDAVAPPMLLVHGNADEVVPYVSSVDVFNAARAPKGLLTIEGGDHVSPVNSTGPAFTSVVAATTDFFDRYLKGQTAALGRLRHDAKKKVTALAFVATPGQNVTIPVPSTVAGTLHATVTPSAGLTDNQAVTVSWDGYQPKTAVNVLECSTSPPTQATDCDLGNAKILQPDPTGTGHLPFTVVTGAVGSGTCGGGHPGCVIVVNQGGSLAPTDSAIVPISFAG